jgi:hypothetical protein
MNMQARSGSLTHRCRHVVILLSLAQYSDAASAPARPWLSFPRACLACASNPETSAGTGKKIGILRAAATRENGRTSNQQKANCHYTRQLPVVALRPQTPSLQACLGAVHVAAPSGRASSIMARIS